MSQPKYEIARLLSEELTQSEAKHLLGLEKALLEQHQKDCPEATGFFVDGKFFTAGNVVVSGSPQRSLGPTLIEEGRSLSAAVHQLETDKDYLLQMFSSLLRKCVTNQDIRDALPDGALVAVSPSIASLTRQREEGWSMQDSPLRRKGYERLKTRMYTHLANRMLY